MQQNIYFRKDVWDKFKDEENKSGLINELLADLYRVDKVEKTIPKSKNIKDNLDGTISIDDSAKPAVFHNPIKTPDDAVKVIKQVFPNAKSIEPVTYKKTQNWGA